MSRRLDINRILIWFRFKYHAILKWGLFCLHYSDKVGKYAWGNVSYINNDKYITALKTPRMLFSLTFSGLHLDKLSTISNALHSTRSPNCLYPFRAITSISIRASFGNRATSTALLAGYGSVKCSL